MKKIYVKLGMMVAVLMMAFGLWSCEAAPQTESESKKDVVAGGYDSEVYAKKVSIGKHLYYVVYATCDGMHGHTVRDCNQNHCFLHHHPDCPCRKKETVESTTTDDIETESTDPFDW